MELTKTFDVTNVKKIERKILLQNQKSIIILDKTSKFT